MLLSTNELLSHSTLTFILLMVRRAPTTTLFPYTTLFRSKHAAARNTTPPGGRPRCTDWASTSPSACAPSRRCVKRIEDRKSTRLNSSHLVISYAVFCLKKKRRNNTFSSLQR